MAVAVIATLISIRHTENWGLIIAGLLVGVALGVPPARLVKMTAMPQLVAFYNGVGGGTVALIALSEFLDTSGFSNFKHGESPTAHIVVASLFAAIIGSISFWGSIIAFGKLQEILPGRPIGVGKAQQPLNLLLFAGAVVAAVAIGVAAHPGTGGASLWWMIGLLAAAGVLGLMVVLPIGGADMPVVISLAQRPHRVVRGRCGFGAEQHRDDRGRHDRRRIGFDPDQPDGQGDEPLHPRHRGRRLRWRRHRGVER